MTDKPSYTDKELNDTAKVMEKALPRADSNYNHPTEMGNVQWSIAVETVKEAKSQEREKMANRMEKLLIQHEEKIRQKSPNGDNPEYSKLKSYVLNRFSVLMKEIERMRQ